MSRRTSEEETHILFRITDYRYNKCSTIITSQLEPTEWHKLLGGKHEADSTLDRLTAGAYKIVLSGESMRRTIKNIE